MIHKIKIVIENLGGTCDERTLEIEAISEKAAIKKACAIIGNRLGRILRINGRPFIY